MFGVRLPKRVPVRLNPDEHTAHRWLPWNEAAPACFSWSNRAAIEMLPARVAATPVDLHPQRS